MKSSKDVLDYLNHLSDIKKENPNYGIRKEGELYHIYNKEHLLLLTVTEKIFRIFEEL
jgi:hypothetical protein